MQRGWKATGLLRPIWLSYGEGEEGARRDQLARAVGSTGPNLSSINTGNRRLGIDLARRIASETGVSVLELGAPAEQADGPGLRILRRLEEAEAALEALGPELRRLGDRVAALERQVPPKTKRASTSKKKAAQ